MRRLAGLIVIGLVISACIGSRHTQRALTANPTGDGTPASSEPALHSIVLNGAFAPFGIHSIDAATLTVSNTLSADEATNRSPATRAHSIALVFRLLPVNPACLGHVSLVVETHSNGPTDASYLLGVFGSSLSQLISPTVHTKVSSPTLLAEHPNAILNVPTTGTADFDITALYRAYVGLDAFPIRQENVGSASTSALIVEVRPPGNIDGYGAEPAFQLSLLGRGPQAPRIVWSSHC